MLYHFALEYQGGNHPRPYSSVQELSIFTSYLNRKFEGLRVTLVRASFHSCLGLSLEL